MPIKNAIHSQQVYDPTDESIISRAGLLHGAAVIVMCVRLSSV